MRKFQELNFTAQIGLEWLANMLESVENLFNFSVPFVSIVAIVLLLTYTILLSWFSVRQIMLAWIVKDGITTFVGSKRFKNGNFIHFMSRVPDNEELEDYRELWKNTKWKTFKITRNRYRYSNKPMQIIFQYSDRDMYCNLCDDVFQYLLLFPCYLCWFPSTDSFWLSRNYFDSSEWT